MHRNAKIFLLSVVFCLCVFSVPVIAQSNELGVTVGGYFPINSPTNSSNAFAIGGSFDHRLASVPLASLYVEVPVFATFDSTSDLVFIANPGTFFNKYSALFVSPGLKLKLAPSFPISPYLVVGGGLAHFSKSNGTLSSSTNTGVFDVGGGLYFKIAPYLSTRVEVRDFYSGNPDLRAGFTDRQHQVIASGGLVLRF
jgi:hypothetical protein